MTETLPETTTPETLFPAPDALNPELARKNMQWAWGLFGVFWALSKKAPGSRKGEVKVSSKSPKPLGFRKPRGV